jgi:hypothetical protein
MSADRYVRFVLGAVLPAAVIAWFVGIFANALAPYIHARHGARLRASPA